MSEPDINKIWNLKEDAKWGRDVETQKNAVQELGKFGEPVLEYLNEIWSVASREEFQGLIIPR